MQIHPTLVIRVTLLFEVEAGEHLHKGNLCQAFRQVKGYRELFLHLLTHFPSAQNNPYAKAARDGRAYTNPLSRANLSFSWSALFSSYEAEEGEANQPESASHHHPTSLLPIQLTWRKAMGTCKRVPALWNLHLSLPTSESKNQEG